jgi:hypothetical protein
MSIPEGLWRTLRDNVFATWFGWVLIVALVIFPITSLIGTCYSKGVDEDIEIAKLEAAHGDRDARRTEAVKWMVTRGIHPLVARCAVFNDPWTPCSNLIGKLKEKERTTIKEVLSNPPPPLAQLSTIEVPDPVTAPELSPTELVAGVDFGLKSPTK